MPKAFLLKYKKQCEYFAQTPDQIGSCETSTEAINLKIKTNESAQDMMVKGKKIITKIKNLLQSNKNIFFDNFIR